MCVTLLNANTGFYFSTLFHLALKLQNSWVIRPEIMNELPMHVVTFACTMVFVGVFGF